MLDPQLAEILALAEKAGRPPLDALPVEEARREYRRRADTFGLPQAEMETIEERTIAGPDGAIPVRLYVPAGATNALAFAAPAPMLVFFHGGGWTVGDRDTHDRACRYLAREARCRVASVDYRLAPEHPFPAAVEDCWAAWEAIALHPRFWGADARRLAVGGDSAGGNLAAAVAQLATAERVRAPCLQLLIYPAADMAGAYGSIERFAKGYLLTKSMIERFMGYYTPDPAARRDPRASPLRATDLAGLAPAFVQTAGFDPIQDEGAAYAQALAAAGVAAEHRHYPSLVHGYLQLAGYSPAAKAAVDDAARALRNAFK
jgi:acetyl esterase